MNVVAWTTRYCRVRINYDVDGRINERPSLDERAKLTCT